MHTIVVDLGFGDAGKGTVVDWLCSTQPIHAVVRFNGGAQAAHNVITPDGRHHCFSQFGSGTLNPGVRTHLSRYMLVEPLSLFKEADHLIGLGVEDPFSLLTVDRDALVTTPYHRAANRTRELARGDARHGSCGRGIGETARDGVEHPLAAVRVGDCEDPDLLAFKLQALLDRLQAELGPLEAPPIADVVAAYQPFVKMAAFVDGSYLTGLLSRGDVVFEGAQGVLLDEWWGFHPHTTWSTTVCTNADKLLIQAGATARRLGVTRTYTTRHGAGPMVTEDAELTALLPDAHNGTGQWQGGWRAGHFDAVANRYALEVCDGVDALAVTHVDRAVGCDTLRICDSYDTPSGALDRLEPGPFTDLDYQESLTRTLELSTPVLDRPTTDWPRAIADVLGVPLELTSHGPNRADKAAFVNAPLPA